MNDDLILGPYKLPLKKADTGFGYYGAVSLAKDGSGIQCHICGAIKANLSLHLRAHEITVKEYRVKFGISGTTALVSDSHRNASVQRMLELRERMRKEGSLDKLMRLCNDRKVAALKKKDQKGSWKKGQTNLTPEDLNLRGICPDQLVELIKKAHEHYKGTPSYAEFMAFYGTNRFATPIKRTFGSWKNAVKKAGYEPKTRQFSALGGKIKYTDEELVDIMADFYMENGRVPTLSDFKRGYLPTWETYTKRFGSMAEARRRAGIKDFILPRGGDQIGAKKLTVAV